jgi:hypothetical protein
MMHGTMNLKFMLLLLGGSSCPCITLSSVMQVTIQNRIAVTLLISTYVYIYPTRYNNGILFSYKITLYVLGTLHAYHQEYINCS